MGLNLLLMRPLGHLGLALATSATAVTNLLQLALYLRRRIGFLEGRRIARTLLRVGMAGGLSALLCGGGLVMLGERWHGGAVREGAVVGTGLVVAVLVTYSAMKLLRVEELNALDDLLRALRGRFGGAKRPS